MASTPGVRKTHKIYHKTNPMSLPNPYNWELRIRLLDQAGEFIEMVSQIAAFRLLKGDAADLVLVKEPTIQLKVSTEEWKPFAKGAKVSTEEWKPFAKGAPKSTRRSGTTGCTPAAPFCTATITSCLPKAI